MSSGNGKTGRPGELLILSCRFPVETLDAQLHARPGSLVPLAADKLFELRQHPDIIAMGEYLRRLGSHMGGRVTGRDLQEETARRGILGV